MRPIYQTVAVSATDVDVIAVAQMPLAAGNLTLTGTQPAGAQVVTVTSDADETGITFTVYGTNAEGLTITDTIAGPNIATGSSTKYFATVTRIAIDAASVGNVSAGVTALGAGPWLPMDYIQVPFNIGFGCVLTGAANFTVQYSFDDPFADTPVFTALDHPFVAAASANASGNFAYPVRNVRLKINSGTGSVAFTVLQGLGE